MERHLQGHTDSIHHHHHSKEAMARNLLHLLFTRRTLATRAMEEARHRAHLLLTVNLEHTEHRLRLDIR